MKLTKKRKQNLQRNLISIRRNIIRLILNGGLASKTFENGDILLITNIYYRWDDYNNLELRGFKKVDAPDYIDGFGRVYDYYFYDLKLTSGDEFTKELADKMAIYESTASKLQGTIASWYNALRRIALVGLLSVLLYVGIKIVLSSTSAKDKAKYKKMLKDWLVALCILFTLHYIMSITITVVGEINKVIGASAIGANGEDVLMTTIRNKIAGGNEDFGNVLTEVVLYCVLGIFTIIYTIQYIRRTIYIAFLTMIAPLITLTYPLDKIKDGKAQAFDMWIKDYIFFVLIQVVHLLLYYILVGASLDLASDGNWLFAIVAIGFLTKAEKIVKKMFGFEKSKSMGALAAGATGAFVMNAINKIKAPGKASKGGQAGAASGDSGNVRTATNTDVMASIRNGGEIHSNPSSSSNSVDAKPAGSNSVVSNSEKMKRNISGVLKAGGDMLKTGAKGTGALAKRYHRKIGGAALGVGTGLAGSILGFAAGVSQGDMGAAFGGALAGGKAGYNLGGRAYNGAFDTAENIRKSVNNLYDTWNEGAYGEEYANNEKFDREFRRSSTYKTLKQKYGKDFSDDNIQEMLEAGITEQDAMDKILKNVTSGNRYAIKDAMGYYALTKKCKDAGVYNSDAKLKQWLKDNDFGEINDVTQIRKHMKNF